MAGSTVNDAWEYRVLPEGGADQDQLSSLGRAGWELVTSGMRSDERVLYFKRRLPSFREQVTLDQRRAYYASFERQTERTVRNAR